MLVRRSKELDALENNFYFQLLKLELMIPDFGRYIDTRLPAENAKIVLAYKQIQKVFRGIGRYKGRSMATNN